MTDADKLAAIDEVLARNYELLDPIMDADALINLLIDTLDAVEEVLGE